MDVDGDEGNEDEDAGSDDEEVDEYGYPVPRAFNAVPRFNGMKQNKQGSVAGITAQLAAVSPVHPLFYPRRSADRLYLDLLGFRTSHQRLRRRPER